MHWGYKITLAFVAFFIVIMYLVIRSFQQDIHLVSEDYYVEELNYQEQIDKINNTNQLENPFSASWKDLGIELRYPEELNRERISGSVHLYRPSSAKADQKFVMSPTTNYRQVIPGSDLVKGRYIIKLDWTDGTLDYYQELSIFVP